MTTESDPVESVTDTVDLISKKWHPAIVQTLLDRGPLRYNELREALEGISSKVLTESLEDLGEKDLVERTVVSESPMRVEYALTPHGRGLQAALEALADWGDRHLGESDVPTVLVVDDDPRLAEMHADWLSDTYEVETRYSGEATKRWLDESVDVILLDRRMLGTSGDEVAAWLDRRSIDPSVVLLTAVEPDFDVLDLQFDDYIVKPARPDDIRATVEDVLEYRERPRTVRAYLALTAKRALLRAEKTPEELAKSERYARLLDRIDDVEAEMEDEPPDAEEVDAAAERMLTNEPER